MSIQMCIDAAEFYWDLAKQNPKLAALYILAGPGHDVDLSSKRATIAHFLKTWHMTNPDGHPSFTKPGVDWQLAEAQRLQRAADDAYREVQERDARAARAAQGTHHATRQKYTNTWDQHHQGDNWAARKHIAALRAAAPPGRIPVTTNLPDDLYEDEEYQQPPPRHGSAPHTHGGEGQYRDQAPVPPDHHHQHQPSQEQAPGPHSHPNLPESSRTDGPNHQPQQETGRGRGHSGYGSPTLTPVQESHGVEHEELDPDRSRSDPPGRTSLPHHAPGPTSGSQPEMRENRYRFDATGASWANLSRELDRGSRGATQSAQFEETRPVDHRRRDGSGGVRPGEQSGEERYHARNSQDAPRDDRRRSRTKEVKPGFWGRTFGLPGRRP